MRKSSLRREHIRTGTSLSRHIKPSAVALAVAACFSGAALANPVNPTVVHGTASFQQAGNILNITNSANAIINWGSFSISVGELTRFIQPSALSAVLNRVTGQDPSVILGALQSNGRVFLLNPNGIVFGAGAQIDVAGLVASTLKLSNEDFLNNRLRFTDGAGAGSVVNQGSITGGSVYLVGKAVTNDGLITSPNGEVILAAGNSVELVNPGTPNLRVEITAPDNEARNLGTISAEAGRIGIYAGLIRNSGTLNASSAVAEGGRILLKSTGRTTLDAGSVLSASGTRGGEILVLSDLKEGVTEVAGVLDASASAGNGGFVETSAGKVTIASGTSVTTAGSNGGQSGTWLIDPFDFVIAASGGDLDAATLVSALGAGNVVISTAAGGDFYGGTPGNGDIFVNQAVAWSNSTSLTLTAERHVEVNQPISNSGTGAINLYAGWDGSSSPGSPSINYGIGNININANISSGGNLYFRAGNNINVNGAALNAGSTGGFAATMQLEADGGSIFLNSGSSLNVVGGNSGSFNGYPANVYLYADNGMVSLDGASVVASGGSGASAYGGDAGRVNIQAESIQIKNGSLVRGRGGNGAMDGSSDGGRGEIYMYATGANGILVENSTVEALGGFGLAGSQQGSAYVDLGTGSAYGGDITLTGSNIFANGYSGSVSIETSSSGAGIFASNSAITGQGRLGTDGGEGYVSFYASYGMIDTATSSVSALGRPDYYSGINFSADGDVNLGLLIATDFVNVYSWNGAIVDGNTGLNISAPDIRLEGRNGVGSVGNPLEIQGNFLNVESDNGGIGVINAGNLQLLRLYAGGSGSDSAIGATGNLVIDGSEGASSAGNLLLAANGGLFVGESVMAYGTLLLNAGGDVEVGGSRSSYGVSAYGEGGTGVVAGGSLGVLPGQFGGSSVLGSFDGPTAIAVGGNVLVDRSEIRGNPDVDIQVGGVININGTVGYGGRIEASSPSTIHVNFTGLTSGGFSVNGIAGLVYDPVTNTGFFVNGSPASLGNGLNIIYSGTPPVSTLTIPTENLIVAMGESSKPPDPEKDKDVFAEVDEKKKKDAPVCR
jgi:filamentous hemagglutinin family protein